MTDIAFYHLLSSPLETALAKLLEKALASGGRAIVLATTAARIEALNSALWTYAPDSWLPHGAVSDGNAAQQPVWLTTQDEYPNGAAYLFLVDGGEAADLGAFARCFNLFDGNDAAAIQGARQQWKNWQRAGHALTYWKQQPAGGWQKQETGD